jgi:hypothetical protein
MDPMDIENKSFKRKRKRQDISNNSFNMRLIDSNDTSIIQPRQHVSPSKVRPMLHRQFLDIKLVSPLHYSNGAICQPPFDQKVNVGSMMQTSFNINLNQKKSIGVLMYRLKKDDIGQSGEMTVPSEDNLER